MTVTGSVIGVVMGIVISGSVGVAGVPPVDPPIEPPTDGSVPVPLLPETGAVAPPVGVDEVPPPIPGVLGEAADDALEALAGE